MELKEYVRPLLKWWWLLLVAAAVAAVSTFLFIRQQPPVYQARTTLIIGRTVFQANPSSNDLWLSQSLGRYYADLARRQPVRMATMEALGLSWLPGYSAYPLPNSQLIEIMVTDTNPQRAMVVANELATQLIKQTPTSDEEQTDPFMFQQITELEESITTTKDEIQKKKDELSGIFSAVQIAEAENDLRALQSRLLTLQTNYATLVANSQKGAANTLAVIEPASIPRSPVGPNTSMMVLLSAMIGVALAGGAAYVLEYLDDTLKTPAEVSKMFKLPILGYIGDAGMVESLDAYEDENGAVASEGFRYLRTNLFLAAGEKPIKTVLITSPGVSDGKTSVSANLAAANAKVGKKVILLDGDLRKPNVHRFLGLQNETGLSDVLCNDIRMNGKVMNKYRQNLSVITSGEPPDDPAELLSTGAIDETLDYLKSISDLVIIDGPPMMVVDATILATKADAVLLVIRHSHTRKDEAQLVLEQLQRIGATPLGIVLNRIPKSFDYVYSRYKYKKE
jgi:polysaccharide biosynthesis transport protein